MLFNPSSGEVRRFFCEAWARHRAGGVLEPMQLLAATWCSRHPEYAAILASTEQAIASSFSPENGRENPFLHLSMHLAIEEQIATDQPPGIRAAWSALLKRSGDVHNAAHQAMECLGPVLWEAQRARRMPDTHTYLECLRRRAALK
jgi:hypothetical protein